MSSSSNCDNSSSATSFQCTMKKENDGISSNEDDNRSSSQKHSDVKSRKRSEPENEAEHQHGTPNNKKARVVSLPEPGPEPELVHALEPPASFNTLDDDCLGNVLDFVGKKCYSAFGRANKRCHEMFCSKGLPKETYFYGYGPLRLIQQHDSRWDYHKGFSKGVLHYNRRDILEWILTDESRGGYDRLKWLCCHAIKESRLDILREVFQRANKRQLEYLRDCDNGIDLCYRSARYGKLECLKLLRENQCDDHILEYLRNNDYSTGWQDESESERESDSDSENE